MRLHDVFRKWLDRRALMLTAVFAIVGVCIAALMLGRPPPGGRQTLPMPFIGTADISMGPHYRSSIGPERRQRSPCR